MTDVDPLLVARFNHAAATARAGDHLGALAAYLALAGDGDAAEAFEATARMRAAFCLMDLERWGEAADTKTRSSSW